MDKKKEEKNSKSERKKGWLTHIRVLVSRTDIVLEHPTHPIFSRFRFANNKKELRVVRSQLFNPLNMVLFCKGCIAIRGIRFVFGQHRQMIR
jgi:hypothetical protein